MKRIFVAPAGRGSRAGRRLAEGLIAEARRLGYARMLLDTVPSMDTARRLYASLGFVTRTAYRPNPVPGAIYMELDLSRDAGTARGVSMEGTAPGGSTPPPESKGASES